MWWILQVHFVHNLAATGFVVPPSVGKNYHRNRGFAWRGTHLRMHNFATSLGFLLNFAVWRKITKLFIILDSVHKRISNFTQVRVLIFLSLACSLVLWHILNKKFWDFVVFPIPNYMEWKPSWRLKVRWLAKLAWYDVTWKPPIVFTITLFCFCYLLKIALPFSWYLLRIA